MSLNKTLLALSLALALTACSKQDDAAATDAAVSADAAATDAAAADMSAEETK
jgi:ABC-type enterochelin transport system substrate-binding protein